MGADARAYGTRGRHCEGLPRTDCQRRRSGAARSDVPCTCMFGGRMSTARREARPVKGFQVRLHNRRVYGGLMADGSILWRFKRLTPEGTVYGERIRLSREAV